MASVMENVPPNVFSVKTIGNKKVRVPPKVSIADMFVSCCVTESATSC